MSQFQKLNLKAENFFEGSLTLPRRFRSYATRCYITLPSFKCHYIIMPSLYVVSSAGTICPYILQYKMLLRSGADIRQF